MKANAALNSARKLLQPTNPEEANLISEMLLLRAIGKNRVEYLLEPDIELNYEEALSFTKMVNYAVGGEPLAYITNRCEFFRLEFYIDNRVLIPRPETEILVEKALDLINSSGCRTAADVGTGSGAIAVSLAVNSPDLKLYATDISTAALAVAVINIRHHKVGDRVKLLSGDLLAPLPEKVDLIAANLPYVRSCDIAANLKFEPGLALDGGEDGLEVIRRFIAQIEGSVNRNGIAIIEMGYGQGPQLISMVRNLYTSAGIEIITDFAGINRFLIIRF